MKQKTNKREVNRAAKALLAYQTTPRGNAEEEGDEEREGKQR